MPVIRYIHTICVALSVLVNAILGGAPTETFSYRAARAREENKRWGCRVCKFLGRIDLHHCEKTLQWWREANGRK